MIESQNSEYKKAVHEKLQRRLNLSTEQTQHKVGFTRFFTLRRTVLAAMAVVILCLAVVIPFTLKDKDKSKIRYCYSADCEKVDVSYTIKDYGLQNNAPVLFVDWYDVAEEVVTSLYLDKDNNENVVYFEELIINGETGNVIKLSFCDLSTKVDVLEGYENSCDSETMIKKKKILWKHTQKLSKAYFEHKGYKYYLELAYPTSENAILEIIETMLP